MILHCANVADKIFMVHDMFNLWNDYYYTCKKIVLQLLYSMKDILYLNIIANFDFFIPHVRSMFVLLSMHHFSMPLGAQIHHTF